MTDEPTETRVEIRWPERLSPSGFATWNQCQKRWLIRYVGHVKEPSGRPQLMGTFAHAVLENLFDRPPEERTEKFATLAAREAWTEFSADDDWLSLGLTDPGDIRMFRWDAWRAVVATLKMEKAESIDVKSVEQKVENILLDGAPFVGVIDRLDTIPGGLRVVDYKTGKVPQPRYRREKIMQVLLYAAAILELEGVLPIEARLMFPVYAKNITVRVTPAAAEEAVAEFSATWREIDDRKMAVQEGVVRVPEPGDLSEDTTFLPNVGPLCGWCPYLDRCSEGKAEVLMRARKGKLKATAPAWDLIKADGVEL